MAFFELILQDDDKPWAGFTLEATTKATPYTVELDPKDVQKYQKALQKYEAAETILGKWINSFHEEHTIFKTRNKGVLFETYGGGDYGDPVWKLTGNFGVRYVIAPSQEEAGKKALRIYGVKNVKVERAAERLSNIKLLELFTKTNSNDQWLASKKLALGIWHSLAKRIDLQNFLEKNNVGLLRLQKDELELAEFLTQQVWFKALVIKSELGKSRYNIA